MLMVGVCRDYRLKNARDHNFATRRALAESVPASPAPLSRTIRGQLACRRLLHRGIKGWSLSVVPRPPCRPHLARKYGYILGKVRRRAAARIVISEAPEISALRSRHASSARQGQGGQQAIENKLGQSLTRREGRIDVERVLGGGADRLALDDPPAEDERSGIETIDVERATGERTRPARVVRLRTGSEDVCCLRP